MAPGAPVSPAIETLADLHERLGHVLLQRIRCHPAPGTATEADVLVYPRGEKRLYELVDSVLVEKPLLPGFQLSIQQWFARAGRRR